MMFRLLPVGCEDATVELDLPTKGSGGLECLAAVGQEWESAENDGFAFDGGVRCE